MGKFYLHVGLHKTATTTLQNQFFPFISSLNYLSRNTQNKSSLYYKITSYCFSKNAEKKSLATLRNEISLLLNSSDLLISEEWFTSDYSQLYGFDGAPWEEKLRRLGTLTQGHTCKLLITIRKPSTGLFSLYCELNKVGIQAKFPNFHSFIEKSNDAKTYDYAYLQQVMTDIYGQNITVLPFELLQANQEVFLTKILHWMDRGKIKKNSLSTTYQTQYNHDSVIIRPESHIEKIVTSSLSLAPRKVVQFLKFPLLYKARSLLKTFRRTARIQKPCKSEIELIKQKYFSTFEFYSTLNLKN